jgi:hypothetical protein
MMKKFFSPILLFFFSMYVLSGPLIWATYFVYKDYIAETYCVNKQNPDCCGQCHVREVEDQTPKNESPKIEVRTPEILSFIALELEFSSLKNEEDITFADISIGDTHPGFPDDINQPPKHHSIS